MANQLGDTAPGGGCGGLLTNAGAPTNGASEIDSLAISGSPTGGTFTLSWGGFTTAPIAYNASAATVQAALRALINIGNDVTCTGGALPGSAVTITWGGNHANTKVSLITANGALLTGGSSPAAAVTQSTAGVTATAQGASIGGLLIDITNGNLYQNQGTSQSPVWNLVEVAGDNPSFGNMTLTGLLTESSALTITAHAGGGQSSAVALTKEVNVVSTVATAGDSVALPLASAGLSIIVVNLGANPCQVYGSGTDTINGVATATGVSQMPNSVVLYICGATAPAGNWNTEGLGSGFSNGLQTFAYSAGLTAHAGGGQSSALALTALINNVGTVATAGDSVAFPASAPGLEITIINSSANPMQVFGAGTDTINGIATATGVTQMANSIALYVCTAAGVWLALGLGEGYSGSLPTTSYTNSITAHAGGGQASATQLTTELNRITTVASSADSVALPLAAPGLQITVTNAAATNPCQVFAKNGSSDTINGTAGATGVSLAAGKTATYFSTVAGVWHQLLSA
jgi:hypothetical protein